ncbi:hypothetical protein LTS08_002683 [Lithohypha guttulata]|nr:hypothetical protein LTS08_002683 [Lithohypha guttulata]
MPSETDPLLPAYAPAPEISYQHRLLPYSSEISYGSAIPTGDSSALTPKSWKSQDELQYDYAGNGLEESEDDTSSTFESGMAKVFRTVLGVIFLAAVFAVSVSVLQGGDRQPHSTWPPSATPSSTSRPHPAPSPPARRTVRERVQDILTSTPLIDGHNDLAIFIRGKYKNNIFGSEFRKDFENGGMPMNVDLPRMRAGKVGGAFWSAFVVCPVNASYDMSDENYASAAAHTTEQIDLLNNLQKQYPQDFTSATNLSSGDESGRVNMLAQWHDTKSFFGPISIEGLHQVLPSAPMSMLRSYYALGVRMATLTWNCHNAFADAALVMNDFRTPPHVVNDILRPKEGAVTKRGLGVIQEMNRLGMIVDISHTSYWTQKAVLSTDKRISQAPVVFSHSSAYSICPHPRNVRDDILDLVPKSKSLVMVNFSPEFISCVSSNNNTLKNEPHFSLPTFVKNNNTLHQVARHITYIGGRIGYDYVGLGSDYDGMGDLTPQGLDGVDKFPDLVAELLTMGVSDEDVKKVVGGNILRVWKDVDEVSARIKKEGVLPGLDDGSGY